MSRLPGLARQAASLFHNEVSESLGGARVNWLRLRRAWIDWKLSRLDVEQEKQSQKRE
jgi:hypothetical protein